MESPGVSRIAADEAWESEVALESEAAPASSESEMAPALPESEMAPEPEERPSMLSRLASWRAPEPEPEMERAGETEAPAPPRPADAPRQLHCDEFHCRAPPGRLGLAFKGSTRVVARVNEMSALPGTAMSIVWQGDELVSVNDCVVADDVLGVLAAQDDGTTDRTLAFARASGRRPEDYYACYAPPGDLCIAFESDARRLVGALSKGNGYEPGFVVRRVDPTSALRGVVAEGDALVTINEVPCCRRDVGPLLALAQTSSAAYPRRRLVFARKGFRLAPYWSLHKICCLEIHSAELAKVLQGLGTSAGLVRARKKRPPAASSTKMGSRQDSQGPLSRGIRGGGFVGSGGVGSVFRTSRGAESFDFDLAGKHPLAHVVNNGLQGHRPRKAHVHANRTSPKRPRPKPEETVAHDGDWRLLCEHADGSHEVFRVSNPPDKVFEKIRAAGGVSQKHRFALREVLARNGIDVRRVTCLGWKHAPDTIHRSEREKVAYEREVARIKGANRPMEWLGPSGHELNLERMRLSLSNVAERPGLGG